jgi:pre-rRNA-processing protein TSR3
MQYFPPTYVLRHRKENLNKCSLRGLETRDDFIFLRYPIKALPPLNTYLLLALDGKPLTAEDKDRGLFVLDATWAHAQTMRQFVDRQITMETRSIPAGFRTAYPRRQPDCENEEAGLASIEAIYIAYSILGRDVSGLLDNYHWKEEFLSKNSHLLLVN